ncbi:MAG: RNA polymerase sigma factor [Planctomycetes bacterium]|nr:RNA polymerase sigma factor [Planctomycetota bacterium]
MNDPEGPGYSRSTMHCEATQLMTAARSGDEDAFEALFLKVRGVAVQSARSLVGSHADALDMTQEAFIKAYKARDKYDPDQPFLPWFHRILRNTCFSFLRKRGRSHSTSLHAVDSDGESHALQLEDASAPRPSDRVLAEERREQFDVALERLSARDREILVLRHYQELSYREISEALEIPEGTVMSRLFHARKRLRVHLAPRIEDLLSQPSGGGRSPR